MADSCYDKSLFRNHCSIPIIIAIQARVRYHIYAMSSCFDSHAIIFETAPVLHAYPVPYFIL